MSETDVYFLKFTSLDPVDGVCDALKELFIKAGFDKIIFKNDLTAIKVHFGEEGNSTFIKAPYITPIVDMVKKQSAKAFVTDSNVLYKSQRDNAVDHILLAHKHGFSLETIGAPIVIADGTNGANEKEITINAPLNKTVSIASEFINANSLMVVTHVTGHLCTGLGATIKNLGMGMSSRKGKLRQHSVSKPNISKKYCTSCGTCLEWCPEDAIELQSDGAWINKNTCIGCGECIAVCRDSAVKFNWDSPTENIQKQIAEHALGIVSQKKNKMGYYTFLINMTRDCDCLAHSGKLLMPDIGVLVGSDPVAIDKAVLDITTGVTKQNIATMSYPAIDPMVQLEYGQKIGLGSLKYKLIEV